MQKNKIKISESGLQNLKALAHMYEGGLTTKEISEQIRLDEKKVKMFLRKIGYAVD